MNAVRHYSETIPLRKTIPFLAEEGWRDSLIEAGAPGAKREPARSASAIARSLKRRAKPQLVVSSAEMFRRSDHPVCAFASLGASSPPLRGGEYPPSICAVGLG